MKSRSQQIRKIESSAIFFFGSTTNKICQKERNKTGASTFFNPEKPIKDAKTNQFENANYNWECLT
jgi:hypothetical protein